MSAHIRYMWTRQLARTLQCANVSILRATFRTRRNECTHVLQWLWLWVKMNILREFGGVVFARGRYIGPGRDNPPAVAAVWRRESDLWLRFVGFISDCLSPSISLSLSLHSLLLPLAANPKVCSYFHFTRPQRFAFFLQVRIRFDFLSLRVS